MFISLLIQDANIDVDLTFFQKFFRKQRGKFFWVTL